MKQDGGSGVGWSGERVSTFGPRSMRCGGARYWASVCRRFLCFVSFSPLEKEMKCRHAQWLIVLSKKIQHITRLGQSRTTPNIYLAQANPVPPQTQNTSPTPYETPYNLRLS